MGRSPKIRLSFRDDIAFLLRLEKAVEDDKRLSVDDKREVIRKSAELRMVMSKVDQARLK